MRVASDGHPLHPKGSRARVLLSSVDMTISLIDAYGQCRDEANTHEQCMSLIRETLDHARSMIGH